MYSVEYDDGDIDVDLSEEFVKAELSDRVVLSESKRASDAASAALPKFSVGERVKAMFRRRARWFPGQIVRVDGTGPSALYTVAYDDGDLDNDLHAEHIQRQRDAPLAAETSKAAVMGELRNKVATAV